MAEIELKNVTKAYRTPTGTVRAVDDVSLSIQPGEFFFLLGPSGCGKTTLLRIVAGLVEPSAGSVWIGSHDVTRLPVQKRNTALVFQNYALWPHMTVLQNVQFGPRMKGMSAADRRNIAEQNLRRVQMEEYALRKPNQLSGGQQQRVALARALAASPRCLLLDEPLSNLDARLRLHMRGELRRLVKETGATGLYVTHDQKEALSMADRIAVMDRGRVIQVDTPRELYRHPANRFVADFLGEANFLDGHAATPGPPATVRTPAGDVQVAAALEARSAVTLCVRPEQVRLIRSGAPAPAGVNSLAATIESETFLGETHQFTVRLAGDARWKVTCFASDVPDLTPGDPAQVLVPPGEVSALPA